MSRPAPQSLLRRMAKAAAPLLFVMFVAAACSSDGFPESYSDQIDQETELSNVHANWLEGCTVGLGESDLAEDANSVCECSYQALSGEGGIAFADFVQMNNELKSDPTSLASSESLTAAESQLLEIVKGCIAG